LSERTVELTSLRPRSSLSGPDRLRLQRRARLLAWTGNGWHLIEFGIALGAGISAGSIALVGFGVDSLVEALASLVIVWLFTGSRVHSATAEQRAQRLIALSYLLLAAYIVAQSVRDLAAGHHPGTSWIGIGLAAFAAVAMPLLARAKRDVGRQLSSSATVSEAGQNMLCAYLSVACSSACFSTRSPVCGGQTPQPHSSSRQSHSAKGVRAGAASAAIEHQSNMD
jgi:divalent metal cation (Fe/Co/Zn/Cd) transporter